MTFEQNSPTVPFVVCDYATADGGASMPLVRKLIGNLMKTLLFMIAVIGWIPVHKHKRTEEYFFEITQCKSGEFFTDLLIFRIWAFSKKIFSE